MLTAAGNVRPADARELISLLGTGDEGLAFRSAPVATTVSFGSGPYFVTVTSPPQGRSTAILTHPDRYWT
jgi:hypothetical protein